MNLRNAALTLLSLALLSSAQAPGVTIKVGTQAPKGTAWMKAMEDIARQVKKKTDGKVEFKFYPNGTLGDEKVVINRMKTNEIDGGLFTGIGLGQVLPAIRILELPFLFRAGTPEQGVIRDSLEPELIKGFEEKGFVFLGWAEVGMAYMFSKAEVTNLAGLREHQAWFWQDDPLAEQAFKTFGLKGVPLSLTDVLPSLNSGMIETVYNSPYGLIGLQWHTKVKYMSRVNVGHGTGGFIITRRAFNNIPAKYRDEVLEICRKRCRKLLDELAEENAKAEKELEAQGVKILPVAKEDEPTFEKLSKELAESMAGKLYTKETLDKVNKQLAEMRAAKKD